MNLYNLIKTALQNSKDVRNERDSIFTLLNTIYETDREKNCKIDIKVGYAGVLAGRTRSTQCLSFTGYTTANKSIAVFTEYDAKDGILKETGRNLFIPLSQITNLELTGFASVNMGKITALEKQYFFSQN